ncbi:MAG: TetR/AcrR family transcriptional regulator [Naasia sp.]
MLDTNGGATATATARLRNEPVQARSAARLDALLDAAATVLDEVGYERLTTALIAQRASASIGTVYRYFPDRLAVLEGLADRAADRLLEGAQAALAAAGPDIAERLTIALDCIIDAHRADTGFQVVCVFESMRVLGPRGEERHGPEVLTPLVSLISSGQSDHSDLTTALFVGEALVHRAFEVDRQGDAGLIEAGKRAALRFLADD